MTNHQVVTPEAWVEARAPRSVEPSAPGSALGARHQAICFEGPEGKQTLGQLFNVHSQLIVYHFMFGPDWEAGCKSCSFWPTILTALRRI
jgi:hypothetical protein